MKVVKSNGQLRHVLVVDDDPINNFIITKNLGLLDKSIICTSKVSGDEALQHLAYVSSRDKGSYPYIILVDINMPGMNGYEFLEVYEQYYYKKFPGTKIFVISALPKTIESNVYIDNYESVTGYLEKTYMYHGLSKLITKNKPLKGKVMWN